MLLGPDDVTGGGSQRLRSRCLSDMSLSSVRDMLAVFLSPGGDCCSSRLCCTVSALPRKVFFCGFALDRTRDSWRDVFIVLRIGPISVR